MARTYDELLKDTSFMEMIFTEISKLDNIVAKLASYASISRGKRTVGST